MPEVGNQSRFIPSKRWKEPAKTKQISGNDGINYVGIDFPTPVKQIEKLEAQNPKLAINVFGWENDCVIAHQISQKQANVPRINLKFNRVRGNSALLLRKKRKRFAFRSE